jgi:O-antigen ligase
MSKFYHQDNVFQYLIVILAFLMPLTVFGANLIIVIICLLWFFAGKYKVAINNVKDNKLLIASIIFFSLHVIGLLWTSDLNWGLHIVHKMWYFLLFFPILYSLVREEFIKYYIYSFLFAIALTELVSYLVWFEIIPPFKNATVTNPTPFMNHISYNPILAFAIYIVLHQISFNKKLSNLEFTLYSFFSISMIINMFITGGRMGHVVFFIIIAILVFQIFGKKRIKAILIISLLIPSVFLSAYQFSELFQQRVNLAVFETNNYSNNNLTSIGQRIAFSKNSFELIKKNPIVGVGTGDFPTEYKIINQINTPNLPNTSNPHNMFVLISAQLGLVGLISLLSILFFQIQLSFKSTSKYIRDVGVTLPIIFFVMMFSDSYLLGHYTSLFFIFFSSFLYKDFGKY